MCILNIYGSKKLTPLLVTYKWQRKAKMSTVNIYYSGARRGNSRTRLRQVYKSRDSTVVVNTDCDEIIVEEAEATFCEIFAFWFWVIVCLYLLCMSLMLANMKKEHSDHFWNKVHVDINEWARYMRQNAA